MQRPLIIIVFTRMICGHPFLLVIGKNGKIDP